MSLKKFAKRHTNASQFRLMQDIRYEAHLQIETMKNAVLPARRRTLLHIRGMRDVKLHWGCGSKRLPGWLNVDGWATPATDYVLDMRNTLPLSDNSVEIIFTEHVLEHFHHKDARGILADFHRTLKPGGMLRVIVPDLQIFAQKYIEHARDFMREHWKHCRNDGEIINSVFYDHFHRTIFDYEMLRHDMVEIGFSDVRQATFRDSEVDALNQDTDHSSRLVTSLYVEARK
ncbi:MAG: methyltransferase domain-containing protein [Pseudomonadota bacterium]